MKDFAYSTDEWIEPNGFGGFASGTASGIRTRRYHSLLPAKTNSDAGSLVLVNGFDAQVDFDGETRSLTSHRYAPDVVHPDGASRIVKFESTPWPRWSFQLTDRLAVEQEIFIPRGGSSVVIAWKLIGHTKERVKLKVRLFFSGRDSHSLHRENDGFSFQSYSQGEHFIFRSYPNVPAVIAQTNAFFLRDPVCIAISFTGKRRHRDLTAPKTSRRPAYSVGISMATARCWPSSHKAERGCSATAQVKRTSPACVPQSSTFDGYQGEE